MKKLPKVYQNSLVGKVDNNRSVFDSLKDTVEIKNKISKVDYKKGDIDINLSVKEKIKHLINQNSYIFNTEVILFYSDKEEKAKIAGVVNNHIITMDNKIIKIDDLKDLKIIEK